MLLSLLLLGPPPGPGVPLEMMVDRFGKCAVSVIWVGDDGLSNKFNGGVVSAVAAQKVAFCEKHRGHFVVYTNTNVRPLQGGELDGFAYNISIHGAADFLKDHGESGTILREEADCTDLPSKCASSAVARLLCAAGAQ